MSTFSYVINPWGNITKYYFLCVNVQHIRKTCISVNLDDGVYTCKRGSTSHGHEVGSPDSNSSSPSCTYKQRVRTIVLPQQICRTVHPPPPPGGIMLGYVKNRQPVLLHNRPGQSPPPPPWQFFRFSGSNFCFYSQF